MTLNPVVGVVRVAEGGSIFGGEEGDVVFDETVVEKRRENEPMESGALADLPTRNRARGGDDHGLQLAAFRFTIADNRGLISDASDKVGLGHSFLRSMERSLVLVNVVDLPGPRALGRTPHAAVREKLEKYKTGLRKRET
jgi:GTP-binding protein